jgi:PAS domain S-box-containing protein
MSMSDNSPTESPAARAAAAAGPAPDIRALLRSGNDEVFRRLVDGVRDYAIFLLTPDGHIASWNAGAEHIKGYKAADVIGKHFSIFYTPEALAVGWPAEELRRALAVGRLEDEGWRVRSDGSRFWADVVISPVRDGSGELLGFSKVTRDLTERREHESRLRESERNLRLLVEGVQDYAIFRLDPNGVIVSWNLGAQRIKGYTAEEAIGRHFSMFYTPDAVASGWPQDELVRASADGRFEDEGWRVCKDGTRIWANVVITAIRDEQGDLLGFSKVTRDLTERRRHEELLREREENLRLLVEGVKGHAMFLLDAAGRIRTWNAGAQRMLGYPADEVLERPVGMLYPAEEAAAGRAESELASATAGGFSQVEGWRQKADGTKFWADIATTVLLDAAGQTRGFVQIVRDLTERRRVETLETEGRRIGEFIAMLSHELRNPLVPIRNAMGILQKFARTPEVSWCVELVGRQVAHMTRLVDDLLDVSRVTSGKIRLEAMPLELNTMVEMAIESARPTVQRHGHALTVRLAPHPIPVLGDTTRLTQVVVNLLTNAAKYTPRDGHIKVAVASTGKVATLQVSDNGIGMSESLLQHVFEPFVQGERTLDRAEGGLGIGLTLVKSIAELHGGAVTAGSAGAGKGTTVTVTLPISNAGEEAPAALRAVTVPTSRQVLLVDDNKDSAESLAMLLRLGGHEVQMAHDGHQALALAAATRPSIVLLDIGLPGMNGYEVARRLKQLPGMSAVRLVAITGYGQEKDRIASADAGFELHLTKPVDPDELIGLLR